MEPSDLASNAITFLHDEDYLARFATPLLTADDAVFVGGRDGVSLDGPWRFTLDNFDTGLRQRWFELPDVQGGAREHPFDYDPFDGDTIPVPSSWNLLRPEWFHYEGPVWYSRHIEDPRRDPAERLVLRIGAANYCTRIFVNGAFVGRHRGGSTPVFADLSGFCTPGGRHHLMVHVENRPQPDRVPCHHTDWFNYGGIHREVALYRLPAMHIRDLIVRWRPGEGAVVLVETSGGDGTARVSFPGLDFTGEIPVSAGVGRAVFDIDPQLWSPEAPTLYDVDLTWKDDRVRDRVGFRHIAVEGRQILLNGEPVFLRGICVHEDDEKTGRVTGDADIRRRFADAKALGCNFLRLAHYPHHEQAARVADEVGLLLWAEVPTYWAIDFANPDTFDDAANQLVELIRRDRNRASILCWGLANETPDTDARLAFLAGLAEKARMQDWTRPLAAACLHSQATLKVADRLADEIDIVGINEYFGWYDPDARDFERLLTRYDLDKPLVISETGADAVAGNRGDRDTLFTEENQAFFYARQVEMAAASDHLAGFCPWLLYDFRTERRQNRFQRGWNRKGLIGADKKTRKLAFETLRRFYRTKGAVT